MARSIGGVSPSFGMSDLKCAKAMLQAAERDFLTLRGMTAGVPEESFGDDDRCGLDKPLFGVIMTVCRTCRKDGLEDEKPPHIGDDVGAGRRDNFL